LLAKRRKALRFSALRLAVLRKPFKPETLAEAVQTALHGVYPAEPNNVVLLQRDRR